MDQILTQLQNICKKYLFQKKVFLLPSYIDGNAFKKGLTLKGFSALNFNISTLFDLARQTCFFDILERDWKILDSTLGHIIIYEILKKLSSQDKLSYFKLPLISISLANSIFKIIKEIRGSGYSTDNFPDNLADSSLKMKDLFLILLNYEQKLLEMRLIDEADIYLLAEKSKLNDVKTIFLVPSNLTMNELERRFFKRKIKPGAVFIQFSYLLSNHKKDSEPLEERVLKALSHRGNIEDLKLPPLNMEFYQSYGEYNEARTVLKNIIKENYPFDQVQVFYTTQEPYSQFFYQLSKLYNIPITLHSGISIKNSHAAKFLFSLLEWINDNFSISKLLTLFKYINIEKDFDSSLLLPKLVSLLRESPIGWGRERYLPGLNLAIEERKRKIEETSDEKGRELSEEICNLIILEDWIKKVFAEIPEHKPQGPVLLPLLTQGLANLVNKYGFKGDNELDEEGAQIIISKLSSLGENFEIEIPINEALLLIKNIVEQERINCSPPRPGHLHIASYKKGIWINRLHTFLIGMDYQKFPVNGGEDQILFEEEKGPFRHLFTGKQRRKMEQLRLLQLILFQKGRISLSFSSYNTTTQREQVSSDLLFQLYRLQKKNRFLDYSTFCQGLNPVKGFIPQNKKEIMDNGEYFLYFAHQEKKELSSLFNYKYYNFLAGVRSHRIRREEGFNIYNGKIEVDANIFDPRESRGILVSASKLERIAYCPFLYFLVDILKIKPPKETVYDPTTWLNPLERGLLLHQIYEEFYKRLLSSGPKERIPPSYSRHWKLLERIVEESLVEKRKLIAPPNELIFEAEKTGILESCQVFLREEEEIYKEQQNQVQYLELAFGTRDCQHEVLGKVRSVELELPDGKRVSVQGKIDRVDRLPDGTFRVIDYKTGRSDEFKKNNPFRYGRQIQHALYAIALEKILNRSNGKESFIVRDAGYYFPTIAGRGNLILYGRENREKVFEIITLLLNIVAEGNFPMIQKADDFICSDYKEIFEQNIDIVLKGKKAEQYINEPALNDIRRLQQYD